VDEVHDAFGTHTRTFRREENGIQVFVQRMRKGDEGSGAFSLHNQVQIFVPKRLASQQQFADLTAKLFHVAPQAPTRADLAAYAENAFVRLFQEGVENLSPAKRASLISSVKATYGVSPSDVVIVREVGTDRVSAEFTQAAVDKMKKATGNNTFVHSISGGGSAKSVLRIIAGDNPGLLATTTRFTEGINTSGASSMSDIRSGGADYVFTRSRTTRAGMKLSSGNIQIKPDILRRLDWYAYQSDEYGAQNPWTWNWGDAVKRRKSVYYLQHGAQEIMFKHKIAVEDMEAIWVNASVRDEVLRELRKRGITRIAGKPIELFIQVG
jgi:hypothetical protein